jgi:hypothetical protein
MIVGVADGARVPSPQRDLFAVEYSDVYASQRQILSGPFHPRVIEEANVFDRGANWLSAPKTRLLDETFQPRPGSC